MSAKKTRPTKTSESTKAAVATAPAEESQIVKPVTRIAATAEKQKPLTQRKVLDAPVPETCPQGGAHDWADDECPKCHEPKLLTATTFTKDKADGAEPKTNTVPKRTGAKTPRKPAKAKAEAKSKRLSALDAAAKVLAETKEPMATRQMIEVMAKKGYWTSPRGQTPAATLYSAILRQINAKGKDARFKKVDRGQFALVKGA